MTPPRNVVVAQSGGPSPVINNSLRGVVETCRVMPDHFGVVYAGHHGIEGILREELLDLSAQDQEEISLLRTTPAAGAIGTCRYKLRHEEDLERVIEVFKTHDVGYFFYIGGNDSPTRSPVWPTSAGWNWSPPACPRRLTTTSATQSSN
jgi:6-phosphofructokinase 1